MDNDKEIAAFIKKQRESGVSDVATAEQFGISRPRLLRNIAALELKKLDCGRPARPGKRLLPLVLPK